MQAYSIIDPKSGEVAVSGNEIKRISLEYCREVLTKNEAEGSYKKEIALKGSMHIAHGTHARQPGEHVQTIQGELQEGAEKV